MSTTVRTLRLTPAVALLFTLGVSGALLGQDAASPAREARPVATVEGVISQIVSLPTPGSKPVLSLLDGLLTVDTANAKIQDFYGEVLGAGALRVGGRVVASVTAPATPGQPLAAQLILVAPAPNEGLLNGAVEAVDAGAGTFRVLGATVRTNAATKWIGARMSTAGDPASGALPGIQSLEAGDQVMTLVKAESGAIVARRVLVVPSSPMPDVVRLSGTVKAIGAASWTVTADGKDVVLAVTERTRFAGDPQIGDKVEVVAQADAAGALTALLIAKATITPPVDPSLERFRGTVKAIASAAWVVTREGKDVTLGITAETKIVGEPKVGDAVEALAQKDASGALRAVVITKVPAAPSVPGLTSFTGTVRSIEGSLWTVDDVKVMTSRTTAFLGNPGVGDRVKVLGQRPPSGTGNGVGFVAVEIAKL